MKVNPPPFGTCWWLPILIGGLGCAIVIYVSAIAEIRLKAPLIESNRRLHDYCYLMHITTETVASIDDPRLAVDMWRDVIRDDARALEPCLLESTLVGSVMCHPSDVACVRVQAQFALAHWEYGANP